MSDLQIFMIALGLAIDALAVSMACGVVEKEQRHRNALRFGVSFGGFQMIMPVIGWGTGRGLQPYIISFDHWVAFVLLSLIGGKMIYEALTMEQWEREDRPVTGPLLLSLGVATSIDAMVVGFSFALLDVSIIRPVITIGIVTFVLSYLGYVAGNKFGHVFENKMEILGGVILLGMGAYILWTHLVLQPG